MPCVDAKIGEIELTPELVAGLETGITAVLQEHIAPVFAHGLNFAEGSRELRSRTYRRPGDHAWVDLGRRRPAAVGGTRATDRGRNDRGADPHSRPRRTPPAGGATGGLPSRRRVCHDDSRAVGEATALVCRHH